MKKMWFTKFALTKGIMHLVVKDYRHVEKYLYGSHPDWTFPLFAVRDRDAFETEELARAKAVQMVDAKLKSIRETTEEIARVARLVQERENVSTFNAIIVGELLVFLLSSVGIGGMILRDLVRDVLRERRNVRLMLRAMDEQVAKNEADAEHHEVVRGPWR